MEEIHQLKIDKTKEKGSQHDLEHVTDKEETPAGGVLQNTDQRFITMAKVAALLEQEKDSMHEDPQVLQKKEKLR